MSVLIVAEHDNQQLKNATFAAIAAGLQIDKEIVIAVMGSACQPVATQCAQLPCVQAVLVWDDVSCAHPLAERMAEILKNIGASYTHILFPATTFGKSIAPRLSALLDVAQISDVTAIRSPDTFERPIYAGNAMETVQTTDPIKILTVRATAFALEGATSVGTASIQQQTVTLSAATRALSEYVSEQLTEFTRPELTSAERVVSGGRGLQNKDNFQLIEQLADKIGAAVGASRAAVDAGFVPNDFQVGQTGKVVAPKLYIAIGISGAIQHLAGMKDSKVIVAINKDPDAPIFQIADYGLVGDLFTIIPDMLTLLDKQ